MNPEFIYFLGSCLAYFFSCGGLCAFMTLPTARGFPLLSLSLSVGGVAVKERTTTTWCNNTPDIELALQHHELLCCCCCRISPIFLFFSLFDVTIFTISWKSDLKVRRMDRFLCCNFCVLFFRERNDGARNLWVGVLFRYFIFPFCWRISF